MAHALRRFNKAADPSEAIDVLNEIMAAMDASTSPTLLDDITVILKDMGIDGGRVALAQIDAKKLRSGALNQVNELALKYARERAASMLGKSYDAAGNLIDNPNASYRIDESTRELVRADVTRALTEGVSNDVLADRLAESYGFSDARAEMIARTEMTFADVQGNLTAYAESGVVEGKQWLASAGCCDDCQALDGVVVALDEDFPDDGGNGPPLHPNCECDVLPVLPDLESLSGD